MENTDIQPTYADALQPLREEIDMIDGGILALLGRRSEVVRKVGALKKLHKKSMMASDREAAKFGDIQKKCAVLGLNFDFVAELWSTIMFFSKVAECEEAGEKSFHNKGKIEKSVLRDDLLKLTLETAEKYDEYCSGKGADAIGAYRKREKNLIENSIGKNLPGYGLALDLGCATGQVTEMLEGRFEVVKAFDVCPHMCEKARERRQWSKGVSFKDTDLSVRIPTDDATVDFLVANFGCASELGQNLLPEVRRVLKPGGKTVLSYYNQDALLNFWFYPWPSTVRARLNRHNDTLEVWTANKVFTIEAAGKTVKNLRTEFRSNGLEITDDEKEIQTYPTLQSILPRFFFTTKYEDAEIMTGIARQIDEDMAKTRSGVYRGTYILAEVQKRK